MVSKFSHKVGAIKKASAEKKHHSRKQRRRTAKWEAIARTAKKRSRDESALPENAGAPDWATECENCGERPVVTGVGLCGPCCGWGGDTAGGNW